MSESSSVSRRVWRGALIALAAVTLGTTTTAAWASEDTTPRASQAQPGTESRPIEPGGDRRAAAEAEAAPGDVTALAASNLSYNTVDPCRLFDTRSTGAGPVGAGRPYVGFDLLVRGQCGLPADGSVKAIMVNVIAIDTVRTGYIRADAYPYDPNGGPTVLNFNNGLIGSNAIPLTLCDTSTDTCDYDLGFIVNTGSAHVVFDLVGYFA